MIKVGLVGTVAPERCGIRIYNEELVKNANRDNPDIQFHLIDRPFDGDVVMQRSQFVDIVHVSHVTNMFHAMDVHHINALKVMGKKTVCTWHDSTTDNRMPFTLAFDRTVVHQPTVDGFQLIYHGVPFVDKLPERELRGFIGTSGFPIPFKNYPMAARLAKAVGKKLYAFLPVSQHGDAEWAASEIYRECPGSIVQTGFPPHEVIVDTLAKCDFSLFPYRHETTGIGGSMRVGIGAQRPVIITNVIRFLDVLTNEDFKKEFYVINNAYPTFDSALPTVIECAQDVERGTERIPVETLKAMSWKASAQKYVDIYRELMKA